MSETETDMAQETVQPKRAGLLLPIVLMFLGVAGGFVVVHFDPLGVFEQPEMSENGLDESSEPTTTTPNYAVSAAEFVELPAVVVALGPNAPAEHLRFSATLDIKPGSREQVEVLLPRINDVLVTYLRAVRPSELQDPAAFYRLRAQMMRRISLVVGGDAVQNLLITEFILG